MNSLEVRLLGGLLVSLGGTSLGSFPTRWSAGLFAYLALNQGRRIPRDLLATLFWPEETDQRARKGLRNALWRLRSQVEMPSRRPCPFLTISVRDVSLNDHQVWVDVTEFDRNLQETRSGPLTPEGVGRLERCVALYRGHFLEGYDFEWSVFERERLRLSFLGCLELLLQYHMERREWLRAIHRGEVLLRYDPLREHVHRSLMACHHFMGNRPRAILQFRTCARVLQEELGIAPLPATRDLLSRIERGEEVGWKEDGPVRFLRAGAFGGRRESR